MEERKPNGYWKDFKNVKKELKPIIKELGYFPNNNELEKRGLGGLITVAYKQYGGLVCLSKKIGHKIPRKPSTMSEAEKRIGLPIKMLIDKLYSQEKRQVKEIASIIGININTLYYWMRFVFHTDMRKASESKTKYRKEQISECWNKWLKEHDNKQPTLDKWKKVPNYPSRWVISNRYGTWNNFVKEMGGKIIYSHCIKNSIYADTNYTKNIVEKILETVSKKPEELTSNDFNIASKKLRKNYSQILVFYQKKFNVKGKSVALDMLVKDLYGLKRNRIEITSVYSLKEGLEAYFRYSQKSKAEGKRPASIQGFFTYYNPVTLEFVRRGKRGPLCKYFTRYQKEMRKLEGKLE